MRIFFKLILLSVILCGCQNQPLYKDTQVMMGTFVEVISPDKKAANIVFSEIKRIEGLLSKYNPESEVSKLNKSGKLKVSPETFYIIKRAKEFWQASDGAFDITVAPLVDLWGFSDKNFRVPEESEIRKALVLVGSEKIILQENNNVIQFSVPGMKVDLGAIAKGYAVDCAVKKLKENNINSCLINAGGQIYCLGNKFGKPWNIAIRNPRGKDFVDRLWLQDKAVSTSGGYEQFFIKDNKRYCHILNPKTGSPGESGVRAVTVIASDGLSADALSTAIFVLGRTKGKELAKKFADIRVEIINE